MSRLFPGSVDKSFVLVWGPWMFFVGGLLQVITGIFQVLRNNIYGAVAFLGFGCFWFSNGATVILETHFSEEGSRASEMMESDDAWGYFVRHVFIFAFCCTLWLQTFVMNRLSTTLISLLCMKVLFAVFTKWSKTMEYFQLAFGWATSAFAFYVFLVEFANQVYHREFFKWNEDQSPEEVFGLLVNRVHSTPRLFGYAPVTLTYQIYGKQTVEDLYTRRKVEVL